MVEIMTNVTSQVAAEVIPELANIDIMFKGIIGLFVVGVGIALIFAIYNFFNN